MPDTDETAVRVSPLRDTMNDKPLDAEVTSINVGSGTEKEQEPAIDPTAIPNRPWDNGVSGDKDLPGDAGVESSSSTTTLWEELQTTTTSTTLDSTTSTVSAEPSNTLGSSVGTYRSLVTFNTTNLSGNEYTESNIYKVDAEFTAFGWVLKNNKVELTHVTLWGEKEGQGSSKNLWKDLNHKIDDLPMGSSKSRRADEDSDGTYVLSWLADGTGVRINMTKFNESPASDYRAKSMAIQVDWEHDGDKGHTRSEYFTIAKEPEDSAYVREFENDLLKSENKDLSSQTEAMTSPGNVAKTTGPTLNDTDQNDGDADSGNSGLSAGAIAGISVGAVVALVALVGALVFFFLRRRRRQKSKPAAYENQAPDDSGHFIPVSDKEAHHVSESPHSAFSADQHAAVGGVARDNLPSQQAHSANRGGEEYASYRDEGPPAESGRNTYRDAGPSMDSGRNTSTTQGVPTSVAHLVEDGMTAEEIRRLEEEERQLDDAIERHGRR